MVHRLASAIGGDSTDDWTFVAFVVYSFFFIVLVQLIGILLGDRSPIQVPPLLPSESSNLCSVVHIQVNLFQKLATSAEHVVYQNCPECQIKKKQFELTHVLQVF